MKKGIAEPISWILLVGLTIALAGMVTFWIKNTAESTSEKVIKDVENDIRCNDISINSYEKTPPLCSEIILQNRGLFSLTGIKLRNLNKVEDIMLPTPLLPGKEATISLNILTLPTDNKTGIIPIINIDKDSIACMQKEIEVICT